MGSACRDETDPCHAGVCQSDGSGGQQCVPSVPAVNASNGVQCFRPEDPCQVGDCDNGFCSPTGTSYDEKCPEVDGNMCTRECQVVNGIGVCLQNGIATPGNCAILSPPNNCQPGQCAAGSCVANGPVKVCTTPTISQCEHRTCDVDGTGQPVCGQAPSPGIACSHSPAPNECQVSQCNDSGGCVNKPKPDGTDCTDASPCKEGTCDNASCTQLTLPVNTVCVGDTNNCTNQVCDTNGNCVFGSCVNDGVTTCDACTQAGVPGVLCQNSVPTNLGCHCGNM